MSGTTKARLAAPTLDIGRPHLPREDTQQILSYYHSPEANDTRYDRPPLGPTRQLSKDSTSSSNYSPDSPVSEYSEKDDLPASALSTSRTNNASEGGANRRRMIIVEMDSENTQPASAASTSGSIHSRRKVDGSLDGLALVAPPDVRSPKSYITPPSTAPLTKPHVSEPEPAGHHTRSMSEVSAHQKKPRDIAVVGTSESSKEDSLQPPIFQKPQSRSPSRSASPEKPTTLSPPTMSRSSTAQTLLTPDIGQEKELTAPVASPVVMDLSSHTLPDLNSKPPSSFLHYQPGLHSMAGPLPPPPKASFTVPAPNTPPPPRPPRLHSPPPSSRLDTSKQSLRLPTPTSPTLPARSIPDIVEPSPTDSHRAGSPTPTTTRESSLQEAMHHREGAFPPSVILGRKATADSNQTSRSHNLLSDDNTVLEEGIDANGHLSDSLAPTSKRSSIDSPRSSFERSRSRRSSAELTSVSGKSSPARSPPSSYHGHTGPTPSPPPKSAARDNFTNNLSSGLKRFSSLPRTPSQKSLSRSSSTSRGHARDTSPMIPPLPLHVPRPPVRKIKAVSPPAMFCGEVTKRKTPAERCLIYAQKINELYAYDCGLGDWIVERKLNGTASKSQLNGTGTPTAPSGGLAPQPRQTSRSSMISSATFPRRPDAMIATDLSVKPQDVVPPTPPVLPYPSLATVPPPRSSSRDAMASPASSSHRPLAPQASNSKSGGFFSSLGRKASVRKDRPGPLPTVNSSSASSTKLLKSPPAHVVSSRQVNAMSPNVPGGPRAPPNRAQRSQTLMVSSPGASSQSSLDKKASILERRPSMATVPSSSSNEAEFEQQVDKLAEILPHADRKVLGWYLRKAGPYGAIGQYLEDEKNNTISTE